MLGTQSMFPRKNMDYVLLIVTVIFFWVATKFKGQKWYHKIRWRPLALQCLFSSVACFPLWTEFFHGPYCWDYSHFFFLTLITRYEITTYLPSDTKLGRGPPYAITPQLYPDVISGQRKQARQRPVPEIHLILTLILFQPSCLFSTLFQRTPSSSQLGKY